MDDLRREILAEIRRILSGELEFPGPVEMHHELAADLEVDSVGALVLAVALEDRFRVKLAGIEAASVVSVEDLVEIVERAIHDDRPGGDGAVGEADFSTGERNGEGRPIS